ncbi:hypothetical protein [Undibacterium sp. Ji49W]|uniref:hypothetical protein n=1 Tax=Undibacterium sp. Ji49W TaxID=3413040 RepID=UPI003BF15576
MPSIPEITNALKIKGASNRCSRCNNTSFEVVGEQTVEVITTGSGLLQLSQKQDVHTVLVACSHCGNISIHALGILTKPTTSNWI